MFEKAIWDKCMQILIDYTLVVWPNQAWKYKGEIKYGILMLSMKKLFFQDNQFERKLDKINTFKYFTLIIGNKFYTRIIVEYGELNSSVKLQYGVFHLW